MLRTVLLIAALSACGCGGGGTGSACHADADCAAELACAGPNDRQACGIPPREECTSDADCTGVSGRCHLIGDPCSADGFGSQCRPACTGDAACGVGLRCDAGACVAIACNAGFACANREVCDPARITAATPVYDRHHGCFPIACSSDGECAGLSCVNGRCQDGPGTCVVPVAVP